MKRQKTEIQAGTSTSVRRGRPANSVTLCLVLLPLLVAAVWYRHQQVSNMSEEAKAARCMANMHLIYRALEAYREDHGGHYPASLSHFVVPPGEIYVKKYGRRE